MTRFSTLLLVLAFSFFSIFQGCEQDEKKDEPPQTCVSSQGGEAADTQAGAEVCQPAGEQAGETPAGEDPAGEAVSGESAGELAAGDAPLPDQGVDVAGEAVAGELVAGETLAGEAVAGEAAAGEVTESHDCAGEEPSEEGCVEPEVLPAGEESGE